VLLLLEPPQNVFFIEKMLVGGGVHKALLCSSKEHIAARIGVK